MENEEKKFSLCIVLRIKTSDRISSLDQMKIPAHVLSLNRLFRTNNQKEHMTHCRSSYFEAEEHQSKKGIAQFQILQNYLTQLKCSESQEKTN